MPTIDTGIPSNIRRPGVFSKFLFSLAGRSLTPLPLKMVCIGMMHSSGSASVETPYAVLDDGDGDTLFGVGSEVALMIRKAFEQGRLQGNHPQIYGIGIAEPSGTKRTTTFTITGPATADGNAVFRIAGRTIVVGVASGDTATTVAAALDALADAMVANLPVTSGAASGVTTFTHVTKGENGNDVDFEVVSLPSGLACVVATGAAGSGVVDVTNSLNAALALKFNGLALANRKSADVTDAKAYTALSWAYNVKKWGHVFIGDPSTLSAADTLALASNSYTVVISSCEDSPSLPGEIAAATCCKVFGTERPNANHDRAELALYPPPLASVYSAPEIETALLSGATPLIPTAQGDRLEIVRLVTTHTLTSGGSPDFATFDLATSRVAAWMADQIDAAYDRDFTGEDALEVISDTDPADVRTRMRDMIVDIHYDAQEAKIIRDVDTYKSQIRVEEDESVPGRINVIDPFRVVSPLHQAAILHHAYL